MAQPVDRLLSACAREVRSRQPDRYLASLFAPARAREALFALYAFDHEIAKVRQVVSQPIAGFIRLQWWRDALDPIEQGAPPAHPAAQALHPVLRAAPGCRAWLEAALDARERELEEAPPADLDELERQLEGSSAAITQAALVVLGASAPAALEVGRRIGLVVGLAERLRSLDLDPGQAGLLLPTAELRHHGVDPATAASADLAPVIRRLAERGLEHLRAARTERRAVKRAALAALLPGTLAGQHLGRLCLDPETAARRGRAPLAPLGLLWRHVRGRF